MSSRFFLPPIDFLRRDRRKAEAFGNGKERYSRRAELFSDIYYDDLPIEPLFRDLSFTTQGNDALDSDCEPTIGGPTFLLAPRNFDRAPLRMQFANRNPTAGSEGHILNSKVPNRLLPSVHFMDEDTDPITTFDPFCGAWNARNTHQFPPGGFMGECERLRADFERDRRAGLRVLRNPWSATPSSKSLHGDPRIQQQLQASENLDRQLSTLVETHGDTDWRRRRGAVEQSQDFLSIPFGRAMKWLHGELGKSTNFYSKFQEDYDREISSIKKYASAEVLNRLWELRVSGKEDQRFSAWSHDGAQDVEGTVKYTEKFKERRNKLHGAMEAALNASLSQGTQLSPKTTTIESRKRLQQKVSTTSKHIVDLLNSVSEAREYCEALLSELRLLMGMVDPKDGKNKSLYSEDAEYFGGSQEIVDADDADYGEDSDSQQLHGSQWDQ